MFQQPEAVQDAKAAQSHPLEIVGIKLDEESVVGKILLKKHWAQRRLFAFIDQPACQAFLVSLLFISLFMGDAWTLGNQPDSNNVAKDATLMAIFIAFCMECIILALTQKNYLSSIFFPLDMLGTISIILDISIISSSFMSTGVVSNGAVLRSTRAAKLGARYGRLMRILKLTRFLRYLPCFRKEEAPEPSVSHVRKVTTTLIARLSQHVAAVIMIAVIVVPFMSYSPNEASPMAWLESIKFSIKDNPTIDAASLDKLVVNKVSRFYRKTLAKVYSVEIYYPPLMSGGTTPLLWSFDTRGDGVIRADNLQLFTSTWKTPDFGSYGTLQGTYVKLVMDLTEAHQQESMLGILLVIMVILLLVGISSSLQFNVDQMVVGPLEKMTDKLMKFGSDMLKEWKATLPPDAPKPKAEGGADDEDEDLEDLMLEKMIEKVSRIIDLRSDRHNEIELTGVDDHTKKDLKKAYSRVTETTANQYTVEEVPDDGKEALRLDSLQSTFQTVDLALLHSWEFDVLDYTHEQLFDTFIYLYDVLNIFDHFRLPRPVFAAFLKELSGRYVNTNTYHNFHHGCDVAHTVYRLIMVPSLHLAFSHLEVFSILTAALAHDVGHPGLNNVYLIKAKHALALQYNDKSPLENMHCVQFYDIVTKAPTNIFTGLTEVQWRESRKIILRAILATDMAHHFECIKDTNMFAEINSEDIHRFCRGESPTIEALGEEKNRHFLLDLCLHCADISNPYKSWKVCERWADLVIEEFCQQGDREKKEGLEISPMCDRAAMNLCNSQLGFIEFVVAPLIIAVVKLFPPLFEVGENVSSNFQHWCDRQKLDIDTNDKIKAEDKAAEKDKVEAKKVAFREKMSFTSALRAAYSQNGVGGVGGAGGAGDAPKSLPKGMSLRRVSTLGAGLPSGSTSGRAASPVTTDSPAASSGSGSGK